MENNMAGFARPTGSWIKINLNKMNEKSFFLSIHCKPKKISQRVLRVA